MTIGWFIFTACVAVAYMAGLTASLVAEDQAVTSNLWYDARHIGDKGVAFGTAMDGPAYHFFNDSYEPVHRSMFDNMEAGKTFVNNFDAGIQRVRDADGNYVFICEKDSAIVVANKRPCDLLIVDPAMGTREYAFAVRPDHERVLRDFNVAFSTFKSDGTIDRIYAKWFENLSECGPLTPLVEKPENKKKGGTVLPLALPICLGKFAFAFAILGAFMIVSLITLAIENVFYSRRGRSKVVVNKEGHSLQPGPHGARL
ncbi:PREDICTED: glutamate receptor 3-like [Priapulus caudatus]|uniref:Glutamate receptor 3-like n=1 Tax=Priapulus caudatus TaxID=37621 RepID=A0ABM1E6Q7_PRICU|nr:PREDICTED: glutamate receptor 3-like [Priapulus caudatus]